MVVRALLLSRQGKLADRWCGQHGRLARWQWVRKSLEGLLMSPRAPFRILSDLESICKSINLRCSSYFLDLKVYESVRLLRLYGPLTLEVIGSYLHAAPNFGATTIEASESPGPYTLAVCTEARLTAMARSSRPLPNHLNPDSLGLWRWHAHEAVPHNVNVPFSYYIVQSQVEASEHGG